MAVWLIAFGDKKKKKKTKLTTTRGLTPTTKLFVKLNSLHFSFFKFKKPKCSSCCLCWNFDFFTSVTIEIGLSVCQFPETIKFLIQSILFIFILYLNYTSYFWTSAFACNTTIQGPTCAFILPLFLKTPQLEQNRALFSLWLCISLH